MMAKIGTKHIIEMPEELLSQLSARIEGTLGIYFSKKNYEELEKKLLPAVKELGFEDPITGFDWLIHSALNKEHIDTLAKHLTIGETYFFRDQNFFNMLEKHILSEIIRQHQTDKKIHIWSAGCATGEEAYSVAILLHSMIPNPDDWDIKIIATDINRNFLTKAQKAIYGPWSFRSTPPEVVNRYFHKMSDREWTISAAVREMVRFSYLNLIHYPYSETNSELKNLNLILCNNVLIYFSPQQVKSTIHHMTQALIDEGWLCVSAVEVPYVDDPYLLPIPGFRTTAFKKSRKKALQIQEPAPPSPPKTASLTPPPLAINPQQRQQDFYQACSSLYQAGRYREVSMQLNELLTPFLHQAKLLKDRLNEIKLLINSYANQQRIDLARLWCEQGLLADKLDPLMHYLFATILQEQGEFDLALQEFNSALYLDPNLTIAHFSAGMLLIKQGDSKHAKRHLRNALEILKQQPIDQMVPGSEGMSVARLTEIIETMMKEKFS